jgi:hypothetical protein
MEYTDFRKRCEVVRSNPWDDFALTTTIVYGCTANEYRWAHRYEVDLVEVRDVENFKGGKGKTRNKGTYEIPQRFFFNKTLGKEPIQGAAGADHVSTQQQGGGSAGQQEAQTYERRSDDGDRDGGDGVGDRDGGDGVGDRGKVEYSANNYPL